jgi:hypothetical protein
MEEISLKYTTQNSGMINMPGENYALEAVKQIWELWCNR